MTKSRAGGQAGDGGRLSPPHVLTLTGELDVHDLRGFSATMAALDPTANVVLDVSMVQFVDTTILAALLHQMRTQRNAGGNLVLAGPCPAVLRLLQLTELDSLIPIAVTVDEGFELLAEQHAVTGRAWRPYRSDRSTG